MQVQLIRNSRLKPGMYLKYAGGLKTVKKVSRGQFGVAIVEFINGDRTALVLDERSTVITVTG